MKDKKNFDYKRLRPFKWFILENFPFLEDSIDVLTNYQLFCKLGEMYNKEVDAINTLGIQVEGITDWFDNLDVQEEVNNKLDEMAENGELEEIIATYLNTNALICFDTVSDLVSSENLVDGSYARTLGYYQINDYGASIYKIRAKENDDVISPVLIELNNGLVADLVIVSNTINVAQYGIKEDDTTDETTLLQGLINYAKEKNLKIVGTKKPIKLTDTIDIPVYVDIDRVYFKFYPSNNYINNYGIFVNANSTHNNWQVAYPDGLRGSLTNCTFENATNESLNCIYNYSNQVFNNLYFSGFNISYRADSNYLDSWKFTNITVESRYESSDYNLQFGFLGDQVVIDTIHYLAYDTNAIKIGTGHNGITLKNIICQGVIDCEGSNVTIENLHMESSQGKIICVNTMLKLTNAYLYHNTTSDHNFDISSNSNVILENVKIRYEMDRADSSTDDYDANITSSTLIGKNCFKLIGNRQDITDMQYAMFKTNLGVSLSPEFIYSSRYSFDIKDNQLFKQKSATGISTSSRCNWKLATGTYYYAVKPVADFTRQIHYWQYTNTYNVNITDTTKGVTISAENGMWRVYRGTSSGSYDHYVDIYIDRNIIIDDGNFCNGFKWQTRTADGVDTFLAFSNSVAYNNKNIITFANNTPTAGTWKKGDIIYKANATTSSDTGWVCIEDGTPRNLEDNIKRGIISLFYFCLLYNCI